MVAMVNSSTSDSKPINSSSEYAECQIPVSDNKSHSAKVGEFSWSQTTQGIILGSFFYGYIITQVPGGWIAARFGGKWVFGIGVLCTAILTLVTPIAARTSSGLFIAVRVLEGLGEGVTFPAMHSILGQWAPPLERTKLGTLTYTGAHFGTVFSLPISGYLCDSDILGGWPSVFYIFGTVGCIWFIFWCIFVYDTPKKHPWISEEEKYYIEGSLGKHLGRGFMNSAEPDSVPIHDKVRDTPWCDILSSRPAWGILVVHVCNNWGFYTLLTSLPLYFKYILHFNITEDGILSALPYAAYCLIAIPLAYLVDFIRKSKILSTTTLRKTANFIGLVVPGLFLLGVGWAGCDEKLSVTFLVLSVGINGLTQAGYGVNHLDLSPRYAGVLLGITNGAATIPGMLGPYVVGVLTEGAETREQWMKIFYIAAGIYGFGALFYLIFGSGERQPWDDQGILTETFKRRISIYTIRRPSVIVSQTGEDKTKKRSIQESDKLLA